MPAIINYDEVYSTLIGQCFVCNYHNSGSFAFPREWPTQLLAWIGPDDPTIRPEMRRHIRRIAPPFELNLAAMARRLWETELIPGDAWVMPTSHWAYELEFGSSGWLPGALRDIEINPAELQARNNGSAVAFAAHEGDKLQRFIAQLLVHLGDSDFALAVPGHPVLGMIHHNKQIWWMTTRPELIARAVNLAALA